MGGLALDLVVWDFDGVLNRSVRDGAFAWQRQLKADTGLEPEAFNAFVFGHAKAGEVLRGRVDILDVVEDWLGGQDAAIGAEDLLTYWFERDIAPDPEVGALLDLCQARKVIGTNNETRRAAFIERSLGFGTRVDHVFASGRMGVAKPDDAFFEEIENWSGVRPARILLIDDGAANVAAAHRRGWNAFHFTDDTRHRLAGLLGVD